MVGNFQINNGIKDILLIIGDPNKVSKLDYATVNYYKNKILNEINRLYCIMPVVSQVTQEDIRNDLISPLEGALSTLSSLNPDACNFKTLVRRLDSIRL